jgi:hypothetical protein
MKKLKDNYSLSLKSMSKTISSYLPWLTWWNLWVVQRLFPSLEMWFEFLWCWPFLPSTHGQKNIYVYTNLWDGKVLELLDHKCSGTQGSLMFLSSFLFLWKLAGRSKWLLLSYLIPQLNRIGIILLKLVVH